MQTFNVVIIYLKVEDSTDGSNAITPITLVDRQVMICEIPIAFK